MNYQPNTKALALVRVAANQVETLGISVQRNGQLLDFGINSRGSVAAGLILAQICTAGLGHTRVYSDSREPLLPGPEVDVKVSNPALACMGCQYGGWPIRNDNFFAIASGPMRLQRGREPVLEKYGFSSTENQAVGVLECDRMPDEKVVESMAAECNVATDDLFLCVAPTGSAAGSLQIVARSVESTMHKLFELQFDLRRIIQGHGRAPLPDPTSDNLVALGRTNDAIMYGGRVTLWTDMSDAEIADFGPQIPSDSSPEFGRSFGELFEAAGGDFYQMDPMLFSAARVTLISKKSGNRFSFGQLRPALVRRSFGIE